MKTARIAETASAAIYLAWDERYKRWNLYAVAGGMVRWSRPVEATVPVTTHMLDGVCRAIKAELEAQLPL